MKQRCLLLLSLFLATLTSAWAQLPDLGAVTGLGIGVQACVGGGMGPRPLSVAITSSTNSDAGFTYQLLSSDGQTASLGAGPGAFNVMTTSLAFPGYLVGALGRANVTIKLQSSNDGGLTWSDVGSPSDPFDVVVNPLPPTAVSVTATANGQNVPPSVTVTPGNSGAVCGNPTAGIAYAATCADAGMTLEWSVNGGAWTTTPPTTQTTGAITYSARCVNPIGSCASPATTNLTITVNLSPPTPTTGNLAAGSPTGATTTCAGAPAQQLFWTGACPAGSVEVWYQSGTASAFPTFATSVLIGSLPMSPTVAGTYFYQVECASTTPPNCRSNKFEVSFQVKPTPGVPTALTALTTNMCSGSPLNFDITAALAPGTVPAGTTYAWAAPVVTDITGTSNRIPGTLANLTDPLVNASNAPIDVVYNVTATADGCSLDPQSKFTITVTVKPKPAINNKTLTICGQNYFGVGPNTGNFTFAPANVTDGIVPTQIQYEWGMPTTSAAGIIAGLAASAGPQPNISATGLRNSTPNAIEVTYTVTPTFTNGTVTTTDDCVGDQFTVKVTVNPTPGANNETRDICSGSTFNLAPLVLANITPAGTQYTWTPGAAPAGITGQANGGPSTTMSGTLSNSTNGTLSIVYAVSQTSADGCVGNNFNVTVNVKPVPVIADKSLTVCSLSPASLTLNNTLPDVVPNDMSYFVEITGDNANVGKTIAFPTTIAGNILALGTFDNNTNIQQSLILKVTPTFTNGTPDPADDCPGNPFNITVFVNPTPEIANKKLEVCSEANTTLILTEGNTPDIVPAAANMSYAISISSAGGVTSTLTFPQTQTMSNTLNFGALSHNDVVARTIIFSVTPTWTGVGGPCTGTPFLVEILVNPKPQIGQVSVIPAVICPTKSSVLTFSLAGLAGINHTISYTQTQGAGAAITVGSVLPSALQNITPGNFAITSTPANGDPNAQVTITYTIGTVSYTSAGGVFCTYTLNAPAQSYKVEPEPPIPSGTGPDAPAIVIKDPTTNKSVACESSPASPGAPIVISVTNDANCPLGFVTKWYNDNTTAFNPGVGTASAPATINTTTGQDMHISQPGVKAPGTITWYVACKNELTGCETPPAKRRAVSFTVIAAPAKPTSVTLDIPEACQTPLSPVQSQSFVATVVCPVGTAVWYDEAFPSVAGMTTTAPTSFPTNVVTTKTWYVACKGGPNNCESLERTPVTFTVIAAPAKPTTITLVPSRICQASTGTLDVSIGSNAASACAAGTVPVWYTTATGMTVSSIVNLTNAGTTDFYVACQSTTGLKCISLERTQVSFLVDKAPLKPTVTIAPSALCSDAPAGITATSVPMTNTANCTGSSGFAENPVWYLASAPTTPLSGAPNMTPTATTEYLVSCKNINTPPGCESLEKTSVTFTVVSKPVAPTITLLESGGIMGDNDICPGQETASFTMTCATGTLVWTAGGLNVASGVSTGALSPATTTTYTAKCSLTEAGITCDGPTASQTIVVNSLPTLAPITVTGLAEPACSTQSPTLGTQASGGTGPYSYTLSGSSIDGPTAANLNPYSVVVSGLFSNAPAASTDYTYYIAVVDAKGCVPAAGVQTKVITIKSVPGKIGLVASKTDVCPNTEVTLIPTCNVGTVKWIVGGPTVTPNAPDVTYTYIAQCDNGGCLGETSEVKVNTHRVLVDIVSTGSDLLAPLNGTIATNLGNTLASPQNTIVNTSAVRKWNIVATGCAESGSAAMELKAPSPFTFKSVDNNAPYAIFGNVGAQYFSQAMPNYGANKPNFDNGVYYLQVELRQNDAPNVGPYPKDRDKLTAGPLLALRNITFEVKGTQATRIGVDETTETTDENWASIIQNPVSEEVLVRLAGKVGEEVQLNMVNLQGQALHNSAVTLEAPSQFAKINVRDFNSGLYILQATKGEKVKTIKVLKVD